MICCEIYIECRFPPTYIAAVTGFNGYLNNFLEWQAEEWD